jgi:hypothetical protein
VFSLPDNQGLTADSLSIGKFVLTATIKEYEMKKDHPPSPGTISMDEPGKPDKPP